MTGQPGKRPFSAAVDKFHPFEVVLKEVIEGGCCYFNVGTVCEIDCHSTSFLNYFVVYTVDARNVP